MMKSQSLLLEIGTEEIPAGYLKPAAEGLKECFTQICSKEGIGHLPAQAYWTPRRLVLYVPGLEKKQEEGIEEIVGPAKNIAFDAQGQPSAAARGFANSLGIEIKDLKVKEKDGKTYVYGEKKKAGKMTEECLPEMLAQIIKEIKFPKAMTWDSSKISFARPIRWILALYGRKVIKFCLGNIHSDAYTCGHLYLSPEKIKIGKANFSHYAQRLKKAKVIVQQEQRKELILNQLKKIFQGYGARPYVDPSLLEEVCNLVEYPCLFPGEFSPQYLDLPRELVITCMQEHERFFPLFSQEGNLLPYFVSVVNNPRNITQIKKGNERVIEAKLSDAQFFFHEDIKIPLRQRIEDLKKIVYPVGGSLYDKTMRIVQLSCFIADQLKFAEREKVEKVALLSRADLTTQAVREYPSLEAVMGKIYAYHSGEEKEIAEGIYEQSLPRHSGDNLPQGTIGMVVGIADRLDTISAFFSQGYTPDGSEDPYALRRDAQGIINIIFHKNLPLSLINLSQKALDLQDKGQKDEKKIKEEILKFFQARIQSLFTQEGLGYDEIEAVLPQGLNHIRDAADRGMAIHRFRDTEKFKKLVIAFKRVVNILLQAKKRSLCIEEKAFTPALFKDNKEEELWRTFLEASKKIQQYLINKNYPQALDLYMELCRPIDDFFDAVMVMVEEEELKRNRLAMLKKIAQLFYAYADFSQIVI